MNSTSWRPSHVQRRRLSRTCNGSSFKVQSFVSRVGVIQLTPTLNSFIDNHPFLSYIYIAWIAIPAGDGAACRLLFPTPPPQGVIMRLMLRWFVLGLCWCCAMLSHAQEVDFSALYREATPEVRAVMIRNVRWPDEPAVSAMFMAGLTDPDTRVRAAAAHALGQRRDQRAVEPLIALQNDPSDDVRVAVCSALGQIGDPRAIPVLIKMLGEDRMGDLAVMSLRQIGLPMVDAVLPLLKSTNRRLRERAIYSLAEIADPRVDEALAACLNDPDTRRIVIDQLVQKKDLNAFGPLCKELNAVDIWERIHAIESLGRYPDPRVPSLLLPFLTDDQQQVRHTALHTLLSINPQFDATAAPTFVALLQGKDQYMREGAIKLLGHCTDTTAADALVRVLQDPDLQMRLIAVAQLRSFGKERALAPLLELEKTEIVANVQAAILCVTAPWRGMETLPALLDMQARYPGDSLGENLSISDCLNQLADTQTAAQLLEYLKNPDARMRAWAADALCRFGSPVVDPLIAALHDTDGKVRTWAIYSLGAINDERACPALINTALHDSDFEAREIALDTLGEMRDSRALPALLASLHDPDVASTAQEALFELGHARALPFYLSALDDPALADDAIRALGWSEDPRATEPLLQFLRRNPGHEELIFEALGAIKDPQAIPTLIAALDHPEHAAYAAAALANFDDPRVVPALAQALQGPYLGTRQAAVKVLVTIAHPAASRTVPDPGRAATLAAKLADVNSEVRWEANEALDELGEVAVAPVTAMLKHRDPWTRDAAAWTLGRIKSRTAIPALTAALNDPDVTVRATAVWALGEIRDPGCLPTFLTAMQSPDAGVSLWAEWAIDKLPQDDAQTTALLAALQGDDTAMRTSAALVLGTRLQPQAMPVLLEILRDGTVATRTRVAALLGSYRDRQAIPLLRHGLQSPDAGLRAACATALGEIGEKADVLEPLTRDADPAVRRAALIAYGRSGDAGTAKALLNRYQTADSDQRAEIADGLVAIGEPAVAVIGKALSARDLLVHRQLLVLLGRIRDPQSTKLLLKALQDDNAYIRWGAAQALGAQKDPQAVPALIKALADDSQEVETAAITALAAIGDPRAVAPLLARVQADGTRVNPVIFDALANLGDQRAVPVLLNLLANNDGITPDSIPQAVQRLCPMYRQY